MGVRTYRTLAYIDIEMTGLCDAPSPSSPPRSRVHDNVAAEQQSSHNCIINR